MRCRPRHARLVGGAPEPPGDARRVEMPAVAAGEHERVVRCAESRFPGLPKRLRRRGRERDGAPPCGRLGRACAALAVAPLDAHRRRGEVDVSPRHGGRLADPHPGFQQEPYEQPVLPIEIAEQHAGLLPVKRLHLDRAVVRGEVADPDTTGGVRADITCLGRVRQHRADGREREAHRVPAAAAVRDVRGERLDVAAGVIEPSRWRCKNLIAYRSRLWRYSSRVSARRVFLAAPGSRRGSEAWRYVPLCRCWFQRCAEMNAAISAVCSFGST